MIILDDQEAASSKQAAAASPVTRPAPTASPEDPPPYSEPSSSSETDRLLPPPVQAAAAKHERRRARRRARHRFCKAFVHALILSFFAVFVTRSLQELLGHGHKHRPLHTAEPFDENVVFCLKPKDWKYDGLLSGPWANGRYATATLEFPPDVEALFFLSRGMDRDEAIGRLGVSMTNEVSDRVRAVFINYSTAPRLDDVLDVCLLDRGNGEYGLAFLVADGNAHGTRIVVGADILIPADKSKKIKSIDSNLPGVEHAFRDLDEDLRLDSLTATSSNASIQSGGIYAQRIDIRTTNAAITGTYSASQSLSLHNTNSFMEVTAHLSNLDDTGSKLSLTSEESRIAAKVHLEPIDKTPGRGGSLAVNASSTRGHINLSFDHLPLDSTLQVDAQTHRGSAILNIPPPYEGLWELHGTHGGVGVDTEGKTVDPSGMDRRRRSVPYDETNRRGIIWWQGVDVDDELEPLPSEVGISSIKVNASDMAYLHFV